MVDVQGHIVMANGMLESIFGYTEKELRGKPVEVLLPENFRACHAARREAFESGGQPRPLGAGRDLFGQHRDGRMIPVEIGLSPT